MIDTNLYTWSDRLAVLTHRARQRLQPDAPPPRFASKQWVIDRAMETYERVAGRFDSPRRVPSRTLVGVRAEEEAALQQLGLTRGESGAWIVPDHLDPQDFEQWWPEVPEDLRDETAHLVETRDGHSIYGTILPEDEADGGDSTATSLLYLALVVLGASAYAMAQLHMILAIVPLLLSLFPLAALAGCEKPWEAFLAGSLVLGLPLSLAMGNNPFGGWTSLTVVAPGVLVLAGIWAMLDKKAGTSMVGGFFEKLKHLVLLTLALGGLFLVSRLLPGWLQPAYYFAVASCYPLYYANANAIERAKRLVAIAREVNLHSRGSLSKMHVEPKREQAVRALEDKSPLLDVGVSEGWLTSFHYPYAPDKGRVMRMSAEDLTMHMLVFGRTGGGKTTSLIRPMGKQWREKKCGGLVVLCGKGTLASEIARLLDIRVRPGVAFAAFEGLDANGVCQAFVSLGGGNNVRPEDQIWVSGANDLFDHMAQLLWALHNHETHRIEFARVQVGLRERAALAWELEAIRLEKLGQSPDLALNEAKAARGDAAAWGRDANRERTWLWNPATMKRIKQMVEQVEEGEGNNRPGAELLQAIDFLGYQATPERVATARATIHPEIGAGGVLDGTLEFLLREWPSLDFRQRSSFMLNVNDRLLPLTRGPYLVDDKGTHWQHLEHGVDVSAALYGAAVGVDLPEIKHGRAGLAITAFVKQRIYAGIKARAEKANWRAEGHVPVMMLVDEAQLIVGEIEQQFLPLARSLGLCAVMATQGFESVEAQFGSKVKATLFCNTFQSPICLEASPQTYEYMAQRLGTAPMTVFEQTASGLDVGAAVDTLADSPLNDVNHPLRGVLKRLRRLGAGRMAVHRRNQIGGAAGWMGQGLAPLDDSAVNDFIPVRFGGKKEVRPLFRPEDYSSLLAGKGRAIVALKRAGAPRIDLATLKPVFEHELREPQSPTQENPA